MRHRRRNRDTDRMTMTVPTRTRLAIRAATLLAVALLAAAETVSSMGWRGVLAALILAFVLCLAGALLLRGKMEPWGHPVALDHGTVREPVARTVVRSISTAVVFGVAVVFGRNYGDALAAMTGILIVLVVLNVVALTAVRGREREQQCTLLEDADSLVTFKSRRQYVGAEEA